MTRPAYLDMPFGAPPPPRTANGATPLPPSAAPPATHPPVASPVAEFVSEVMEGKFEHWSGQPLNPEMPFRTDPSVPPGEVRFERPPLQTPAETAAHGAMLQGKPYPLPENAPPHARKAVPPFKMADNPPKPVAAGSNEALLDAIDKVYRAAKDRIAYHERELEKLRAALSPFGRIEAPDAGQPINTAESLIQSLVAAAGQLQEQPK